MSEDKKKVGKRQGAKEEMENMRVHLGRLQRSLKEAGIPVIITFDGHDAAGKGLQIGKLIQALDPRGFDVYTGDKDGEEERMHPFLWQFAVKCPEKGRIAIFDTSWYKRVQADRFEGKLRAKEVDGAFADIIAFEKELIAGGTAVIKLFLTISQKEQKKRFEKLLDEEETAWRVRKEDIERNRHYKKYEKINEEMLTRTHTNYAPWVVIDSSDKDEAEKLVLEAVIAGMERALAGTAAALVPHTYQEPVPPDKFKKGLLSDADLRLSMEKAEYEKKISKLQKKLEKLHCELYRYRIPVILGFEGWDAAGKGGAIRRLTSHLDPRGYQVCPTASPAGAEKTHDYLWRFWTRFPKDGHIAIFDRTWYGRVMVERIEGFCTEHDWQRAYEEINNMEAHLVRSGAVVLKFWIHIDKDEQERRFNDRMKNPEKQWKITDEDWRNREKWELYEEAVNEMLARTSTKDAPWILVEGNSKYYARVKVLETVVDALEEKIKKVEKKKHE